MGDGEQIRWANLLTVPHFPTSPNLTPMLFTQDALPDLANGTITLTFRTWTKPQAKVGGRYRTGGLLLEVDAVTRVDARRITDAEARRAGQPSAEALRQRLGEHAGLVWRIEFRCVGADDRIARRNDAALDPEKFAKLEARLARMGEWPRQTLKLIAAHPGVVSTTLARKMKMERAPFKINVRKLKELGLTESLEVGYRLSPLGEAYLNHADANASTHSGIFH
jgi:hypothetical protein